MKGIRYFTVSFGRITALVFLVPLIIATIFYLLCPVYTFREPFPFRGEKIYNPYENTDHESWHKASLHTHTVASDGKNTVGEVMNAYLSYDYNIVAFTEHSKVTNTGSVPGMDIRAYEHGINISMYHTVNLGVTKGSYRDYPLINTLSHKYDKLKRMRETADVVILAHPDKTRGLKYEDMKYLGCYHYIELDWSSQDGDQPYYDAALSAGHPVFAAASDDCHNIFKSSVFGRTATLINSPSASYENIRDALISGKTYCVVLPDFKDQAYKKIRHHSLPKFVSLKIKSDTTICSFSETGTIRAYGPSGSICQAVNDSIMRVVFDKNHGYIRFSFISDDGVILYTNPVYRYTKYLEERDDLASVNYAMTYVQTLVLTTILVFLLRLFMIILINMLPVSVKEWSLRHKVFILPRKVKAETSG